MEHNIFILYLILLNLLSIASNDYSMVTYLDGYYFFGGRNFLGKAKLNETELLIKPIVTGEMHDFTGSDPGWPLHNKWGNTEFDYRINRNHTMDNCLSWLQEHPNATKRYHSSLDYTHWKYHTPNGDWNEMNKFCTNTYIKGIMNYNNTHYWVCGTFGGFPKAFLIGKEESIDLKAIKFIDTNFASCSRYIDEPMALHKSNDTNAIFIGSGFGLYRPSRDNPDSIYNNSTMLYSNWMMYREMNTVTTHMSHVLSSDVNFIHVVKETYNHLYFFGREISNQYSLINQEDRHAWQSFLLRICKSDLGYKYSFSKNHQYFWGYLTNSKKYFDDERLIIPNIHEHTDWRPNFIYNASHLPTTVFTSAIKVNFGCYLGRRPFSISDNHYWGDNNVVYMNRLVDVIYDPEKLIKMRLNNTNKPLGCNESQEHILQPLIGLFNRPGLSDTPIGTAGALCQLLINKNVFPDDSLNMPPYEIETMFSVTNAHQEVMVINGLFNRDLYGPDFRRIDGYHHPSLYNQGGFLGVSENYNISWAMLNVGKCQNKSFYNNMKDIDFYNLMNYSNIGWPNEMANRFVSAFQHVCQYGAADLFTFNATFAMADVEFKRMFVLVQNITKYQMNKINHESDAQMDDRRHTSPLMIVAIVTTNGLLYRVVLCDFHSALINSGINKIDGRWYDWCLFRHTDQPYIYRQYTPLEYRPYGVALEFRASHLLHEKMLLDPDDKEQYPPHSQRVKDIELLKEDKNKIVLVSNNRHYIHSIDIDCMSYDKCITCASDPKCKWSSESGCISYTNNSFGIQDVLDSGFKCSELLNKEESDKYIDSVMAFECTQQGLWNQKIIWERNVAENKGKYKLLPNNFIIIDEIHHNLVIINTNKIIQVNDIVSCVGIIQDGDKLYNGTEYDWISTKLTKDNFTRPILHSWNIKNKTTPILTIVIVILIIMLIGIILLLLYCLIIKCKSKPIDDTSKCQIEAQGQELLHTSIS